MQREAKSMRELQNNNFKIPLQPWQVWATFLTGIVLTPSRKALGSTQRVAILAAVAPLKSYVYGACLNRSYRSDGYD